MKLPVEGEVNESDWSPPARGRGLKLGGIALDARLAMSPPARGRGLKQTIITPEHGYHVAPRAGAWIETL